MFKIYRPSHRYCVAFFSLHVVHLGLCFVLRFGEWVCEGWLLVVSGIGLSLSYWEWEVSESQNIVVRCLPRDGTSSGWYCGYVYPPQWELVICRRGVILEGTSFLVLLLRPVSFFPVHFEFFW